jgi:hypothetical protein
MLCAAACRVPRSYACAIPSNERSAKSGPLNSKPSGNGPRAPGGVTYPHGTESDGKPASDIGIV